MGDVGGALLLRLLASGAVLDEALDVCGDAGPLEGELHSVATLAHDTSKLVKETMLELNTLWQKVKTGNCLGKSTRRSPRK